MVNGHFICNYLLKIDKLKETFIQMLNLYVSLSLAIRFGNQNDQVPGKRRKNSKVRKNVVEKEAISSVKQAGGFVIIWFTNCYFELMAITTHRHRKELLPKGHFNRKVSSKKKLFEIKIIFAYTQFHRLSPPWNCKIVRPTAGILL